MKIRVVIFEDNDNLRSGLAQLINYSENLECVSAYPDCNNIVEVVKSARPDVVLMDIGLPGINGIEGVKILKEEYPDLKVLMQTVFDDRERIFQSICAGACGYILKGTRSSRILESIQEVYLGGAPMSPSVASRVLQMLHSSSLAVRKDSFKLSEREKEVLGCLVKGMSYNMIASHCALKIDTIRSHIRNIYEKLHVHSKTAAVILALENNLV